MSTSVGIREENLPFYSFNQHRIETSCQRSMIAKGETASKIVATGRGRGLDFSRFSVTKRSGGSIIESELCAAQTSEQFFARACDGLSRRYEVDKCVNSSPRAASKRHSRYFVLADLQRGMIRALELNTSSLHGRPLSREHPINPPTITSRPRLEGKTSTPIEMFNTPDARKLNPGERAESRITSGKVSKVGETPGKGGRGRGSKIQLRPREITRNCRKLADVIPLFVCTCKRRPDNTSEIISSGSCISGPTRGAFTRKIRYPSFCHSSLSLFLVPRSRC